MSQNVMAPNMKVNPRITGYSAATLREGSLKFETMDLVTFTSEIDLR